MIVFAVFLFISILLFFVQGQNSVADPAGMPARNGAFWVAPCVIKRASAWLLLLVLCAGCSANRPATHEQRTPFGTTSEPASTDLLNGAYPAQPADLPQATVVKVVDGDTVDVELDGASVRLRLIGLNTPETVDPRRPVECYGREASAKAHELLDGQTVRLEDDPSQQNRDRYDRLLRYIWLPDGRLYNLEMIAQGYAYEYTYGVPYTYQHIFKQAEQTAREHERGLWAPQTCDGQRSPADVTSTPDPAPQPTAPAARSEAYPCASGQIKGNRNSKIYHMPGQRHYAETFRNVECFDTEAEAQDAGYRRARR